MALPFTLTPLAQLIAAGVGAASASVTYAWRRTPLTRSRTRARRALRPLARESRKWHRALGKRRDAAEAAARAWAVEAQAARTTQVPLEALRDAGARNVRWSALEAAGFTSLADVLRASPAELTAVDGIGRLSAARLQQAARDLAERLDTEPPGLPDADLSSEAALPLAAGAVSLLEARDVAGPAPDQLAGEVERLRERLEPAGEEAGFGRWFVAPFRRKARAAARADLDAVTEGAGTLTASGLLERAREGRETLRRSPPPRHASAETVQRVFRDRYAECCALLEQLFAELRLGGAKVSTKGQGGVTSEVAARVERQVLDTGGVKVTLRRYQVFGAKYLLAQERTILGDEMGLGKTLQALTAMTHLARTEGAKHFFVVAPAGLLPNWSREIETRTDLRPRRLHGDDLTAQLEAWTRDGGVAITSYATLRRLDLGESLQASGGAVDLLAVDEAHFVKNPEAGRTQAVRRLTDRSKRVCYLSGTPMENRPEEFLHLVDAVRPDDGLDLRGADLHLDAAAGSVARFHEAVAKVYLRRNQEDVLTELPDRIEVPEWVDLLPSDRTAYAGYVAQGNFMGMRQAATLGTLVDGGDGTSAKLERLAELLEDHRASGRKVIVFSYFLGVLAAVDQRFGSLGVVSGKVPVDERQAMVDALGAHDGHALLLLQITAGGQGLNIQAASAVVLMEPQTKPSTEAQAIARAHRMGQTQKVIVHRLLAHDSVDATLLDLLAHKQELFDAYARGSAVKDASKEATEVSLSKAAVAAERKRLAARGEVPDAATDADPADAADDRGAGAPDVSGPEAPPA